MVGQTVQLQHDNGIQGIVFNQNGKRQIVHTNWLGIDTCTI